MAVGTTTAILLGLGGASAVSKASGGGWLGGVSKQAVNSQPIPLPQPVSTDSSQAKADEIVNKRRASLTQSVYTNPLGIGGQANVARKTLLGQ